MKYIILMFALTVSGSAMALSADLGQKNDLKCECQKCLIENGVCVQSHGNGERNTFHVEPKTSKDVQRKRRRNDSGGRDDV